MLGQFVLGSWSAVLLPRRSLNMVTLLVLLHVSVCMLEDPSAMLSLTEDNFVDRLQSSKSALVAFVAPWCVACRVLVQELGRVQTALATRSSDILVAQCDVSHETHLAARYQAFRTPLVLLFPDTQILAPGLQVRFIGQLLHNNLLAFATGAIGTTGGIAPPRVQSKSDLQHIMSSSPSHGMFVGFFRSPDVDGPLQDFWTLDCMRRHHRAYAVAHGPASQTGNELWRWAKISWDMQSDKAEEAIVFIPSSEGSEQACGEVAPSARFTLADAAAVGPWRSQVDRFCAWCERQVLAPVAIFDAPRAAALDNTFEWLLLLFAPRSSLQQAEDVQQRFPWERQRLERFVVAACAKDSRYKDVLPVLVPQGADDLAEFRRALGVGKQDPVEAMTKKEVIGDGGRTAAVCGSLRDAEDSHGSKVAWGTGRRRRVALWGVALFNTRTRRKYLEPGGAGWCPGDEVSLCHFTDYVLNGHLPPYLISSKPHPDGSQGQNEQLAFDGETLNPVGVAPPGVVELVGGTFGAEAVEPVAAGRIEVLLFLYAPWCSHSLNFFPLWHALAAAVVAAGSGSDTKQQGLQSGITAEHREQNRTRKLHFDRLLMAQMDGTRNEHLHLPPVRRFPTVLLGVQSNSTDTVSSLGRQVPSLAKLRREGEGSGINFVTYDGDASLLGLRTWLAKHSAFSPPLINSFA